ncbi:hypothetical protein EJP82_23745 [Paenibacillus anaericanus]|uniref:Alpha/beta hydrolase n=1 Tax=Paenibacillus anaericanus TaxID=170367 RepID=A0A433Y1F1_9BACL|nr:hypothetical protein EJP82_23745 [Paenibacillus anaericanus]
MFCGIEGRVSCPSSDSPSNLSDETLQLYTRSIPSCEVVEFRQSGHMIPDDEQEKYIAEVNLFLEKISSEVRAT